MLYNQKLDLHLQGVSHDETHISDTDGDLVKTYGGTERHPRVAVVVALGVDFRTIAPAARRDRVLEIFQLLQTAINEAIDTVEAEFHMTREPVSRV